MGWDAVLGVLLSKSATLGIILRFEASCLSELSVAPKGINGELWADDCWSVFWVKVWNKVGTSGSFSFWGVVWNGTNDLSFFPSTWTFSLKSTSSSSFFFCFFVFIF